MDYKKFLNYLGQLRIYSFLDILVFATALSWKVDTIIGIGFIWLSFLLYLEGQHKDKPRLPVSENLWLAPFVVSLILLPPFICILFALFSFLYTKKNHGKLWGISAPLWRGLQNGVLALAFSPEIAVLAFILTLARNLIGDFRDAEDDKKRSITTIPVAIGLKNNQSWAFYAHMILVVATTIIWFHYSFLALYLIWPIIVIEILSYPLTPRLSNPKYLNIYN